MTPSSDYSVIELRRYIIKEGRVGDFARYFETWFPEAFQQLGALALGQFTEPEAPNRFTWLRAFRNMDGRAVANSAFYYGPVWKEHRNQLNDLMVDSDDVLLLRPLDPKHGVPVLPAVDPVSEPSGATGVVVAQLFPVAPGAMERFVTAAAPNFDRYRQGGARDAGLLVTLDERNNFPQLPVRTDGPFVVWLGVFDDIRTFDAMRPVVKEAAARLVASGLLRGEPELLILKPTPRSRLRWLAR
ncbi:NIPSNAP family protein [Massilia horti]|nr:NIPSNAP family protein [Massilia horti]